jgi:GTP-binding protein HflX
VRTHRQQYRARRKRSQIPVVALVGYTNAGKSTLLNHLAKADVYVADQLFATLDPTTRRVELPGGNLALFTDTVGFIQKLPTALVAAFRATLEEITEADLLLHVVDVTHSNAKAQAESVHQTLAEIGADHIPVLTALNKIDRLMDPEKARSVLESYARSVAISALRGDGIADLLQVVNELLYETYTQVMVRLPFTEGSLIAQFHELGQVERFEQQHGGVLIQGRLPGRLLARYQAYLVSQG